MTLGQCVLDPRENCPEYYKHRYGSDSARGGNSGLVMLEVLLDGWLNARCRWSTGLLRIRGDLFRRPKMVSRRALMTRSVRKGSASL
jgi:hypothetical protein